MDKKSLGLFVLAALAITLLFADYVTGAVKQQQPNILWIITDDQRADSLACYNQAVSGRSASPLGYVESPHIDQLAREGTLFVNAYCNSPACAPSRGSMHTGQYPFHNGIYGFEQTHQQPRFCRQTIPQVMRKNGYRTAHFGKTGYYIFAWGPGLTWNDAGFYDFKIDQKNDLGKMRLGDFYAAPIWKKVNGVSKSIGKEEHFYFPGGQDRIVNAQLESKLQILRSYTRANAALIIGGQSSQPAGQTLDGCILQEYLNYLRHPNQSYQTLAHKPATGADPEKPLFIHLGFHFPHTPVLVPESYRRRFQDKTYQVPPFDKSELKKLPPQLIKLYDQMKIDELKPEEKQQAIRDYYAFCAYGDSLVGQAVRAFKDWSRRVGRDYLIILACGDHGWHLGENGIEAKFAPWDMSNRTAVIVSSSDQSLIPSHRIVEDYVEYVDFAPTIYAASGIDIDQSNYDYLDGYNLARVGRDLRYKRDYVLGEMNQVYGPRAYIRTPEFAFSMRTRPENARPDSKRNPPNQNIRWGLDADRDAVEMALYDLRTDAAERDNVANDPRYIKLADWFRHKLGTIVLGDGRIECDWSKANVYAVSQFALGADNKKVQIPPAIVPQLKP